MAATVRRSGESSIGPAGSRSTWPARSCAPASRPRGPAVLRGPAAHEHSTGWCSARRPIRFVTPTRGRRAGRDVVVVPFIGTLERRRGRRRDRVFATPAAEPRRLRIGRRRHGRSARRPAPPTSPAGCRWSRRGRRRRPRPVHVGDASGDGRPSARTRRHASALPATVAGSPAGRRRATDAVIEPATIGCELAAVFDRDRRRDIGS